MMMMTLLCVLAQGTWAQTEGGNNEPNQNVLAGSGTEEAPYLIGSVDDWCTLASSVEAGNTYDGKVFKMTADIDLDACQVMIGIPANASADIAAHAFGGNFDGQGHTLTINYVSSEDFCAPFRCILENAITIQNLHVTGTINTSGKYAGGIIGTEIYKDSYAYFPRFCNLWSSV